MKSLTAARPGRRRATALQAALNGIADALGWDRTVTFEQEMGARREPKA